MLGTRRAGLRQWRMKERYRATSGRDMSLTDRKVAQVACRLAGGSGKDHNLRKGKLNSYTGAEKLWYCEDPECFVILCEKCRIEDENTGEFFCVDHIRPRASARR